MSILLPGTLNDVHKSAQNKWLIQGSKWFDVDTMALGKTLKDTHKKYKSLLINSKRQATYSKDNFSFNKMVEKLSSIMSENIPEFPKQVELKLPKLNKIGENKTELPKLKLPKLNKI
jgi:hypothetical protein